MDVVKGGAWESAPLQNSLPHLENLKLHYYEASGITYVFLIKLFRYFQNLLILLKS